MPIALLTNHLNPGGITSYVLDLYNGLSKRGYKVILISSNKVDLPVEQHILPIKGKNAFSFHNLSLIGELSYIVKRYGIDLLWAHSRITSVLAHIVSRKTLLPYLLTLHGFYRPNLGRLFFPCQGDLTIAISKAVRDFAVRSLRMKGDRIRVVYNAISDHKLQTLKSKVAQVGSGARDLVGLPRDCFVIGMRSRLSPVKGYDLLIKVMDRLPSNVFFLFSTCGENRKEYQRVKKMIQSSIARNRILWYHNDLTESFFWASIDVFVMPSYQEGFGLTALEALNLDIPVVVSDVGGLPEIIKDGKNGFVFQKANVDQLYKKIMKFLDKPDIMFFLKSTIKETISKFSYTTFLDKIESIIEELRSIKK